MKFMKTVTGCIGSQPPVMPYNNYQVSLSAKNTFIGAANEIIMMT
jgi:hypothetical protein